MDKVKSLRILFAEDLPADAELAENEIRKRGIEFTARRVDTKKDFLKILDEFRPDLIISDYRMPSFDGMQALKLAQERDSTIPVIILTGSMNEETAVECMKAGAANYVIKEHIARLPFAVREALEQKQMRTERNQVEQELAQERYLMNMLMDNVPDHIYFKDTDSRFIRINKDHANKFGLSDPVQAIGKTDFDFFTKEHAQPAFEDEQTIIRTGKPIMKFEEKETWPDGRETWVLTTKMPQRDKKGNVIGTFGVSHDITERKQAEERLQKNEAKLNEAMKIAELGTWEYDVARDQFTFNDQFYTLFHTTAEREHGYIMSSANYAKKFVHPDDTAMVGVEIQRALETTDPDYYSRLDHRVVRADGEIGYVTVHIRLQKDAQGRTVKTYGVNQDITERKRSEEIIHQSEEQFKTLFMSISDGFYISEIVYDDTGNPCDYRFIEVNPKFEQLLGLKRDQIVGKRYKELVPADTSQWLDNYYEVARTGVPRTYEFYSNEYQLHFETYSYQPTKGRISVFVRDITERKRAEEALAQERSLLLALMDNVPDHIYFKDTNGRFTKVNKALAQVFGLDNPAQAVGKTDFDFFTKEHAQPAYDSEKEIMKTGQPLVDQEEKETWPDGRETWVSTTKLPLRDSLGRIIGTFGISRDITVRRLAEEALKKSEEQYRRFFEDDLTGDYVSTPEGRILSCNPAFARIYGFASVDEALKADTHSLYTEPEEREIFLRLLKERRKLEYYESEYVRHDGTRVYCVENAVGIFDQQDNLVQIRGYIFDDTKRKNLERQLIQAQKLESLGTLASGVAHDFNNILGIILGYATLIPRQEGDPESVRNSADAVVKASYRGAALVKQLLTFARKVDVQLQSVRINDLVNEISKLLSETFAKTVVISLHLENALPVITGDPTQIHQVLLNLCVNARDAMPKGGTIGMTTCRQKGETIRTKFPGAVAPEYVELRVADTGMGMSKDTQSRIFEPFFTTKGVGKGTGLGLSVVFGILESHNGFVDVESEIGKGTTFHLYFPVQRAVEIEQAKAETQQVIPGGKETILVVEDEEMLTRLLRSSLQGAGYTVLVAVDGAEAVELFDQHRGEIDLVLSDVGLPKLTGYDVFRRMKRTKPNLKFILASGFIEPQLKSEISMEGVRDFVQKPYSVYEVLKAIRVVLDQK